MAEFLNTEKAYSNIVEIVSKAKNQVVLISPYIKIPATLLERLKYRDERGIKTIVVCRGKDLDDDEKNSLRQLKYLELRFDENLHAKCFYNEESMVITSLNLHEHSQQHNREMGILLTLKADPDVFNEAHNEAEFIVSRAKKDSLLKSILGEVFREVKSAAESAIKDEQKRPRSGYYPYSSKTSSRRKGYCIRCGKQMPYNLDAPYCNTCFSSWVNFGGNPDYIERKGHCHTCDKTAPTSKSRPECSSCYRK